MSFKNGILLILLLNSFILFSQPSENRVFALVKNISFDKDSDFKPSSAPENREMNTIFIGQEISDGSTVLTYDDQYVELVIYKETTPIMTLKILDNTDLTFKYDSIRNSIRINNNFGQFRVISSGDFISLVTLKNVIVSCGRSDVGFISSLNANGQSAGSIVSFSGSIKAETALRSRIIDKIKISTYSNREISQSSNLSESDYNQWKEKISFNNIENVKNFDYTLETNTFSQLQPQIKTPVKKNPELQVVIEEETIIDTTADSISDLTSDIKIKKKTNYSGYSFLLSLLSIEIGNTNFDRQIAIKFISRPGIKLFNDTFEFGFYFSLFLVPSKMFSSESPIAVTNKSNNEWSFGSDQQGDPARIVTDIFDDIFLKLRIIRWRTPLDPVSIYLGEINDLNDLMSFSMNDYNSKIFYPMNRQVSFITRFNLDWFESFIYAENLMPKGLYAINANFKTPSKVFRFSFMTSAYLDTFNLIKYTSSESVFPAQFNLGFSMEPFDLPTFGLNLFIKGGLYLPFSANLYTQTSKFSDMLSRNPASLLTGIASAVGFKARVKSFSILAQFIIDAGVNKIDLYDLTYIALRESQTQKISNWLDSMGTRQLAITDFNFGFKTSLLYQWLDFVHLELSYRISFPVYYDKMYIKISIDSKDRYKFNFDIFLQWQIESLASSFVNTKYFQLNNVAFVGLGFHPHKSISIRFTIGVYPDTVTAIDPWYSKFSVDFSIIIRPDAFVDIKKKEITTEKITVKDNL